LRRAARRGRGKVASGPEGRAGKIAAGADPVLTSGPARLAEVPLAVWLRGRGRPRLAALFLLASLNSLC